jgi:HD-GYP domain-containing protein (c-di-GMP phosphodiesterase class II)
MSLTNEKVHGAQTQRVPHRKDASLRNVWDVLHEFVRDLEHCPSLAEQIHCVMRAIRASIRADAVFTHADTHGPAVLISEKALSSSWRRRFAEQQLKTLPTNRGSCSYLNTPPAGNDDSGPKPQSTIMVRFTRSPSLWIVAMSFSDQQLFRMEELKIVLLMRRIFRDHRRQMRTQEKLTDAVLGVVRGLNEAISAKSPFTSGHSERVARMAVCLGRQMGLSPAFQSDLYLAGLLHDVGKIGIRDNVLQKQGPLTPDEQAHVREHPLIGDAIVSKIKNLAHLRCGVRNHHERFDGRGYPDGLAGDAIPLLARILSVADACDAMMSPRPYRPALPTEQVDALMAAGARTQWDPLLIDHFMACRRQLYSIYEKGIGDSVIHAVEEVVRSNHDEQR